MEIVNNIYYKIQIYGGEKFLDWQKGFTVKEKIFLHLLRYTGYSDQSEVSFDLTQQGISNIISAPRPHVSMALKDLRNKGEVNERICRIINRKRKQKVYFLTPEGSQLANNLKRRILGLRIKVIDKNQEQFLEISQVSSKHRLPLIDLLNQISPDGVLDLSIPVKRPKVTIEVTKPGAQQKYESPVTPLKSTIIQKPQPTSTVVETQQAAEFTATKPKTASPSSQSTLMTGKLQNEYLDYLYRYYPEYYLEHFSEEARAALYKSSEKVNAFLFSFGYFLMIIGAIAGLYIIMSNQILFMVPMIIFLTIGITIMIISATELWNLDYWHNRILILLSITIPIILYVTFFSISDTRISYYDLGLWLIVIITFLTLSSFGTFIPLSNRAQSVTAIGIIIIINAIISLFITSLSIYQVGFWLLSGVLFIFLGYFIVDKRLETLYPGLALGLGLGILIGCGYFSIIFNLEEVSGNIYLTGLVIALWIVIGVILIIKTVRSKGEVTVVKDTILCLYSCLPLILGIILIFFGIFLALLEKFIETLIEVFLGGMIILYGIKRVKEHETFNLVFVGLIILVLSFMFLSYLLLLY